MNSDTRVLWLVRDTSGPTPETRFIGVVADAAIFPDGTSVLRWRTMPAVTEIYPSESAMRQVRELSGRSHFEETQ